MTLSLLSDVWTCGGLWFLLSLAVFLEFGLFEFTWCVQAGLLEFLLSRYLTMWVCWMCVWFFLWLDWKGVSFVLVWFLL